ncbi:probable bifunctional dTTP/UTP pyrophosphatase/methyltransferase protein [Hydractinia symbiolongicarpus]|uniref:probable bifunctional dTTP/UTP pyrophosphatase/methyltransferase protein n=1 Tax=Hydractinia symbiolongicarpus TaxID=13093 RepID=UPI00255146BD|nr:probable bifunctional dTTP/UTP pyrophosphatase/methyltransferase protein [Hydractinia symbiolongicarpus]
MIHAVNKLLAEYDVHLASASPRRKNILNHVGMVFNITPSNFEENLDKKSFNHPRDYVVENAKQKALEVMQRLEKDDAKRKRFVIGTDTVVVAENQILEKPHTNENALNMLLCLNRLKKHEVYSGVALVKSDTSGNTELRQFYEMTQVEFGDIPEYVIKMYADSAEPLDKAGAYGIQDVGGTLVSKIDGCYYNVEGFPLYKFCSEVYDWLAQPTATVVSKSDASN